MDYEHDDRRAADVPGAPGAEETGLPAGREPLHADSSSPRSPEARAFDPHDGSGQGPSDLTASRNLASSSHSDDLFDAMFLSGGGYPPAFAAVDHDLGFPPPQAPDLASAFLAALDAIDDRRFVTPVPEEPPAAPIAPVEPASANPVKGDVKAEPTYELRPQSQLELESAETSAPVGDTPAEPVRGVEGAEPLPWDTPARVPVAGLLTAGESEAAPVERAAESNVEEFAYGENSESSEQIEEAEYFAAGRVEQEEEVEEREEERVDEELMLLSDAELTAAFDEESDALAEGEADAAGTLSAGTLSDADADAEAEVLAALALAEAEAEAEAEAAAAALAEAEAAAEVAAAAAVAAEAEPEAVADALSADTLSDADADAEAEVLAALALAEAEAAALAEAESEAVADARSAHTLSDADADAEAEVLAALALAEAEAGAEAAAAALAEAEPEAVAYALSADTLSDADADAEAEVLAALALAEAEAEAAALAEAEALALAEAAAAEAEVGLEEVGLEDAGLDEAGFDEAELEAAMSAGPAFDESPTDDDFELEPAIGMDPIDVAPMTFDGPDAFAPAPVAAAQPEPEPESDELEDLQDFVVFSLGDMRCVVPIRNVVEVGRIPDAAPVPNAPAWLYGLGNLRGQVLSLIDLRAFFGVGRIKASTGRMVVLRGDADDITAGVMVDQVHQIVALSPSRFKDAPTELPLPDRSTEFVWGACDYGNFTMIGLDVDGVLGVEGLTEETTV